MKTVSTFVLVIVGCFLQFNLAHSEETKERSFVDINLAIDKIFSVYLADKEDETFAQVLYWLDDVFTDDNDAKNIDENVQKLIYSVDPILDQLFPYPGNANKTIQVTTLFKNIVDFILTLKGKPIDNKDYQFGKFLLKVRNHEFFNELDVALQSKVETALQNLSGNLKILFFEPHFCLSNAQFPSYIHTAAMDKSKRNRTNSIFVWKTKEYFNETAYLEHKYLKVNKGSSSDFRLELKGCAYDMYYYRSDSQQYAIYGWNDDTGVPPNNYWDVKIFDDDRATFSQDDRLLCATDKQYKEEYIVEALENEKDSLVSLECQWRFEKCPK